MPPESARPARPGDRKFCALCPWCACRGPERRWSSRQHRQQEVAVAHVGHAEDPGLVPNIKPGRRVQRVGVRSGDVLEGGVGIVPLEELPHRAAGTSA